MQGRRKGDFFCRGPGGQGGAIPNLAYKARFTFKRKKKSYLALFNVPISQLFPHTSYGPTLIVVELMYMSYLNIILTAFVDVKPSIEDFYFDLN